jgi:hypothetical protein
MYRTVDLRGSRKKNYRGLTECSRKRRTEVAVRRLQVADQLFGLLYLPLSLFQLALEIGHEPLKVLHALLMR